MASEPVIVQVLEGEAAIAEKPRSFMGANPKNPSRRRSWHHPRRIR